MVKNLSSTLNLAFLLIQSATGCSVPHRPAVPSHRHRTAGLHASQHAHTALLHRSGSAHRRPGQSYVYLGDRTQQMSAAVEPYPILCDATDEAQPVCLPIPDPFRICTKIDRQSLLRQPPVTTSLDQSLHVSAPNVPTTRSL